jgi:N-methylhydantoinase B/oxoprolinase/acetone carboxylase alpha subunit
VSRITSSSSTRAPSSNASLSKTTRPNRKSWHFEAAQAHALHDLLSSLLDPLGSSCMLMTEAGAKSENAILSIRTNRALDLATLPHAANLCHTYVKLKDRDVAILNEPASAGSTVSDFTLVAGVCFETAGPMAEILIAKRVSFPARTSESGRLEDEGVRVPPMPIAAGGKVNTDILSAMSMHPFAPVGLVEGITNACNELLAVADKLKKSALDPGSELRRASFKRYLTDCTRMVDERLHRLPLGAKTVTSRLPTGEVLKLQLRLDETRVTFDFAGTDASTRFGLTDMQTFSACMAVTASLFADGLPMNAATFSMVQVSAPSRTFLSGRGPVGTVQSTRFAFAAICDLVRAAFAQMTPTVRASGGTTSLGHFQFEFNGGKFWSSNLEPGAPASAEGAGLDAYAIWEPRPAIFAVDEIELNFPLKVIGCGIRAQSGGKGLHRGGDGAFYSFEVLESCKVRWALGPQISKTDGADGGKAGTAAKIEVRRFNSTTLDPLVEYGGNSDGIASLNAGDQIHFFAAGGGGFGSSKEKAKEESAE